MLILQINKTNAYFKLICYKKMIIFLEKALALSVSSHQPLANLKQPQFKKKIISWKVFFIKKSSYKYSKNKCLHQKLKLEVLNLLYGYVKVSYIIIIVIIMIHYEKFFISLWKKNL